MKTLKSPAALVAGAVLAAGLLAGAAPASGESFVVTLRNGNTIETRYRPRIEPDRPRTVLLLTGLGNRIALDREDIREIRSVDDRPGLRPLLEGRAVALGPAPNDAPVPAVEGPDGPPDLQRVLDALVLRQLAELERERARAEAPAGLPFWPQPVTTLDPSLLRLQGLPAGREVETYWALQGLTPELAAQLQGQGTVAGAPPALFRPAPPPSPPDPGDR